MGALVKVFLAAAGAVAALFIASDSSNFALVQAMVALALVAALVALLALWRR